MALYLELTINPTPIDSDIVARIGVPTYSANIFILKPHA